MKSPEFDPGRVAWVFTDSELDVLTQVLANADEVVFDLETTGLDEHAVTGGESNDKVAARVVLAQFTVEAQDGNADTWLLPLSHPDSPFSGRWREVLTKVLTPLEEDRTIGVIGHNVKFDCRYVFATTGIDLASQIVWDTHLSSHLLDENTSARLKVRAAQTFNIEPWDEFDLSKPGEAERVPLFDLGTYGALDTFWTYALYKHHRELMFIDANDPQGPDEIEDARLGQVMRFLAVPTQSTITSVEQRGITLDRAWVEKTIEEYTQAADQLFFELAHLYPTALYENGEPLTPEGASFAPTSAWFRSWTSHAVEVGDLRVAELTPGGRPKWSRSVLTRQSNAGSEVATKLLDHRRYTKRLEFLRSWIGSSSKDSVIHCSYNVGSTVTGRLSSSGPNMQQVTAALKPAFIPRPGYVFADLDFSQIELRVASFIAPCEPMKEAFRRGDDLHTLLAARITMKDPSEVTPAERQKGKSANFGLLYGMSAYGFKMYAESAYGVTMTNAEAAQVHRTFFETWIGMSEWHTRAAIRARQTGQVVSPIGRVRRLPGIHSGNDEVAAFAERAAINAPVQGFASDLMMMAAASIEGRLFGRTRVRDAYIVGTVHDSILVEVPEDRWQEATEECIDRMVGVTQDLKRLYCDFDVPLAVEAKVGTRWGLADVGSM